MGKKQIHEPEVDYPGNLIHYILMAPDVVLCKKMEVHVFPEREVDHAVDEIPENPAKKSC